MTIFSPQKFHQKAKNPRKRPILSKFVVPKVPEVYCNRTRRKIDYQQGGVPFEKNMKKSKFVIVEFLNQYKVRYNQTNLIILKILSVILKSKNIKILLFFIWILNQ